MYERVHAGTRATPQREQRAVTLPVGWRRYAVVTLCCALREWVGIDVPYMRLDACFWLNCMRGARAAVSLLVRYCIARFRGGTAYRSRWGAAKPAVEATRRLDVWCVLGRACLGCRGMVVCRGVPLVLPLCVAAAVGYSAGGQTTTTGHCVCAPHDAFIWVHR